MIKYINKRVSYCIFLTLTLSFTVILKNQNTILRYFFPNKVWVHRANTLIKQKDALASQFKGVEIDIVYADGMFDVNHGPEPSIGLSLEKYFSQLQEKEVKIWLDFKNLNTDNTSKSALHLDSICSLLDIDHQNIIIESQHPDLLNTFTKFDFKTSYYLPTGLHALPKDSAQNIWEKVNLNITSFPTDYISFDRTDYKVVKQRYPDLKKLSWGFYTWGFYGDQNISFKRLGYSLKTLVLKIQMLLDNNIEVLLVSYNSENGNR